MDSTKDTVIPLGVCLDNFTKALNSGEPVTAAAFLANISRYEECRGAAAYFTALLLEENTEKQKQMMLEFCSNPTKHIQTKAQPEKSGLPQFEVDNTLASSVPIGAIDTATHEKSLTRMGDLIKKYNGDIFEQSHKRYEKFKEDLKALYQSQENAQKAAEEIQKPPRHATAEEIKNDWIAGARTIDPSVDEAGLTTLINQFANDTGMHRDLARSVNAVQIALEHPEITTPEIILDALKRGDQRDVAIKWGQAATVEGKIFNNYPSIPTSTAKILEKTTVSAAQFEGVLSRLANDEGAIAEIANRAGGAFTAPVVKRYISSTLNESLGSRRSAGDIVSSTFSAIRRQEVDNEMYENLQRYYALRAQHPTWGNPPNRKDFNQFHNAMADPLFFLMQLARSETGVGATAAGVAGTVTIEAAQTTALKFLTSALPFLPASFLEWMSGPVGWAIFFGWTLRDQIGGAFSALGNWFANGANAGINAASTGISIAVQSALNAPMPKKQWYDDWKLILPLLFSGGIILLVFLFAGLYRANFSSRFIPAGIGGGTTTPVTDCRNTQTNPLCNSDTPPQGVDCNATQTNEQCKVEACVPQKPGDCMWPTTGIITQGPHAIHCVVQGHQESSHENLEAIDIGAAYGTPVYSVIDGTVTQWQSGCADQPGAQPNGSSASSTWSCNADPGGTNGWGNNIIITGQGYVIHYAHLSLQSMGLTYLGKPVHKGDVVGKVDNNGASTGNHLHFGVENGQNIFSLVPLSQDQANQVNQCVLTDGCPKVCPTIYTSVH